ncbi:MAG TPA: phosphoadenosine phosphosulfate reductase family protein, partial [Acetivibrio clariflavus]|nr:phosphoadenosine phosphosulfate reductase family protein [Acetivibrio clariflavus]
MIKQEIEKLNKEFLDKSPKEIICYVLDRFGTSRTILASSLSIEDQVLTEIFAKNSANPRIFFIDTGRHFQSTYDLMEETSSRYGFKYEVYAPSNEQLEKIVSQYGPNMFYESVELRKKCCEVRKVEPLKR